MAVGAVHLGLEPEGGVYDNQTNHGLGRKMQETWDKALAEARANGTPVTKALAGLGVGSP